MLENNNDIYERVLTRCVNYVNNGNLYENFMSGYYFKRKYLIKKYRDYVLNYFINCEYCGNVDNTLILHHDPPLYNHYDNFPDIYTGEELCFFIMDYHLMIDVICEDCHKLIGR